MMIKDESYAVIKKTEKKNLILWENLHSGHGRIRHRSPTPIYLSTVWIEDIIRELIRDMNIGS